MIKHRYDAARIPERSRQQQQEPVIMITTRTQPEAQECPENTAMKGAPTAGVPTRSCMQEPHL